MKNAEGKIKKLKKFQNSPSPILSVYLGAADVKSPSAQFLNSLFHSLAHKNLSEEERRLFKKDIGRIDHYISDDLDTRGKRSFVFFTGGEKLFEVLSFEFYLPPLIVVSYSPYLVPLSEAVSSYDKYMVVLADRKKARLFTVALGEIDEKKDFLNSDVPQKVRQINKAFKREDKILRHIEDHLSRHLKLVSSEASRFAREQRDIHFIILGGHKELIPKLKKHLSGGLRKMVVGEFVTELNIPLNDVFLHSKKVVEEIEKEKVKEDLEKALS